MFDASPLPRFEIPRPNAEVIRRASARGVALLLLAGIVALGGGCVEDTPVERRVVLITLDTVRLDAFERADGAPPLASTRSWAERGRIFERYFSASGTTQPSHATIFTGLHPWQHGVPLNGALLAEERTTLAEMLKAAGYRTGAAIASFPLHSRFGFDQGFDVYHEEFSEGSIKRWGGVRRDETAFHSPADAVAERALELIDELGGERQFFWFHFFDAHAPYGDRSAAPEEWLRPPQIIKAVVDKGIPRETVLARARSLYDDDVRFMDRHIDRVLKRLEQDFDRTETHVLVVSDHGESFGESDSVGHGKRLTPPVVHVPLFIVSPRVEAGIESAPVGTIDLTATLLELADVDVALEGSRSLLRERDDARPVVGMRRTYNTPYEESRLDGSVHTIHGFRFFAIVGDDMYTGDARNLTLADGEQTVAQSEHTAGLSDRFRRFEEAYVNPNLAKTVDEETIEGLRALGYVQ